MNKVLSALFFCIFLTSAVCTADEQVYTWVDESGVTHFSTKATNEKAQVAELPQIMRAEVKIDIPDIASCADHGGVDCQAGSDSDGSVICFDGFKGASARFRFHCSTPKLDISDISEVNEQGEFRVFVRNSKPVKAENPSMFFKMEDGIEAELKGPDSIEAFGIAEFLFEPAGEMSGKLTKVPAEVDMRLTCANCS